MSLMSDMAFSVSSESIASAAIYEDNSFAFSDYSIRMVDGPARVPELVSAPIALSVDVTVPIPMPVLAPSTSPDSDSDSDSEEETRGLAYKVRAALRAARRVAYKRSTSGTEARKRFSPSRFVPRVQATSEYVIPQQQPVPMQMQSVWGGELPALLSIGEAQKRRDIALRSMDLL